MYKGAVTTGVTAGHRFDSTVNPDRRPLLAGTKVNIRVVEDESECGVGSWGETTTDSSGEFYIEDTYAGIGSVSLRVTICFSQAGFATYKYVGEIPSNGDPTQGQSYLNVVLAPE